MKGGKREKKGKNVGEGGRERNEGEGAKRNEGRNDWGKMKRRKEGTKIRGREGKKMKGTKEGKEGKNDRMERYFGNEERSA